MEELPKESLDFFEKFLETSNGIIGKFSGQILERNVKHLLERTAAQSFRKKKSEGIRGRNSGEILEKFS